MKLLELPGFSSISVFTSEVYLQNVFVMTRFGEWIGVSAKDVGDRVCRHLAAA